MLRVLGPDQSTVLFDFDDPTGAANPSTVITNLGATLDLGTIDPVLALELRTHGAAILGTPTLPTVEMQIPFMASAATDTALFEGLGQLYRYLLSASRDHPIFLDWTELSATRYIDVVGVLEMPQLIRGQAQAGIVAGRKSSLGPLTLKLLRQPWMRLATVTTSGVTVPNDPATGTKVRVYPVTVTGDLPTPGRVKVQMTGADRTLSTSAAADDIVDCTAHGFDVNDPVIFTALTGGTGLTVGTTYYVISTSWAANTFQISVTPGGSAMGWSTDITAGTVALAPTVERVLIGHRAQKSRAATFFSDYLSETGFLQCEASGRGWTITLSNNTAGATSLTASPGTGTSTARCTYTTDPTVLKKRVRATRTTLLESLRGSWDVWARVRHEPDGGLEGAEHRIQLRWGFGTTDNAQYSLDEVTHDVSHITGGSENYKWVELNLGRIDIPPTVSLGGLTLELWSRRVADSGYLNFDLLWLSPTDHSTAVLPGGGFTTWLGTELVTPVTSPAGGTAGVQSAGTWCKLDTTTDNAGIPPATGEVLAVGRYRSTFRLSYAGSATATVSCNIRNITDALTPYGVTAVMDGARYQTFYVYWDVTAGNVGDAWQEQVDNPDVTGIRVESITRQYITTAYRDESIRTEPGPNRYGIDRLDSSGNLSGFASSEGPVPVVLEPGNNHLFIRCDEVKAILHDEPENKLARTPTVTVNYDPRMAL